MSTMISAPAHLVLIGALVLGGCGSSRSESNPPAAPASETCRDGVGDDVKVAGRTAGAAAKTGLTAAADGLVQAGSSAAGLVHGGTDEAEQRWKEGGKETKSNARKNAAETREAAHSSPCK